MPFTPSHAVVALPFVRTRLVPAAVAIGAMTPDLPLFFRGMWPDYSTTHDPVWIVPTAMLGLVLLLVWRCVLRPAARELSPRSIADRLPVAWDAGFRAGVRETFAGGPVAWLLLFASLALGVLTHIAWDLLTHEGRLGVQLLPVLEQQWGPLPGVKWLQYGSGLFGLIVLGVFGVVWWSRRKTETARRAFPDAVRIVWWLSLPVALVVAAVIALAVSSAAGTPMSPTAVVYAVLTRVAAVWTIATVVLAVMVSLRRRRDFRVFPRL